MRACLGSVRTQPVVFFPSARLCPPLHARSWSFLRTRVPTPGGQYPLNPPRAHHTTRTTTYGAPQFAPRCQPLGVDSRPVERRARWHTADAERRVPYTAIRWGPLPAQAPPKVPEMPWRWFTPRGAACMARNAARSTIVIHPRTSWRSCVCFPSTSDFSNLLRAPTWGARGCVGGCAEGMQWFTTEPYYALTHTGS